MISEAFQKYYDENKGNAVNCDFDITVTRADGAKKVIPAYVPFRVGDVPVETIKQACAASSLYRYWLPMEA